MLSVFARNKRRVEIISRRVKMKNVSLRYTGPVASAKKVFIKLLSLYKKYHYKKHVRVLQVPCKKWLVQCTGVQLCYFLQGARKKHCHVYLVRLYVHKKMYDVERYIIHEWMYNSTLYLYYVSNGVCHYVRYHRIKFQIILLIAGEG